MPDKRIAEFFETHKDELIQDITRMVAVKSVGSDPAEGAPYGKESREALNLAVKMLSEYGFDAKIYGDRVCVAEYGEGEPTLAILAHLDVVPTGDNWTVCEPFTCTLRDGILYGRGAADDKGPAIVSLYSLRAVKELGIKLGKKVQLIYGTNEERGSDDIEWYKNHYKLPPMVFSPDSDFPVVNTEKGRLVLKLSASYKNNTSIVSIKGGTVVNAVPESAVAVLNGVSTDDVFFAAPELYGKKIGIDTLKTGSRVTINGQSAHASHAEDGINAISILLGRLSAVSGALPDELVALGKAFPFGDTEGKAFGADCSDEISGALTSNLGTIEGDENGFTAQIDYRFPLCTSGEEITAALAKKLAGTGIKIETAFYQKPHHVPADSEFVKGLVEIYKEHTGRDDKPVAVGGLTYVHEIEGGVAFGFVFPGRNVHAHEPNEMIPVSDLISCGEMYTAAIIKFCE